jgi:segregation and condensation protein B
VPGRPALFGTTKKFLDYFSLKSLSELPTLTEPESFDAVAKKLDEEFMGANLSELQSDSEDANTESSEMTNESKFETEQSGSVH